MNDIEGPPESKLITAAANLSTRAIVVTSAQGVPYYRLIQFSFRFSSGDLHPGNEASAVNTEARARNDKCCADR